MAYVSAFIWYLNKVNMYNTSPDVQGFTSPPPFRKKSKMADKDGRKRTQWDTRWQCEHQKLFTRYPEDSKNVGEKIIVLGCSRSDFPTQLNGAAALNDLSPKV